MLLPVIWWGDTEMVHLHICMRLNTMANERAGKQFKFPYWVSRFTKAPRVCFWQFRGLESAWIVNKSDLFLQDWWNASWLYLDRDQSGTPVTAECDLVSCSISIRTGMIDHCPLPDLFFSFNEVNNQMILDSTYTCYKLIYFFWAIALLSLMTNVCNDSCQRETNR